MTVPYIKRNSPLPALSPHLDFECFRRAAHLHIYQEHCLGYRGVAKLLGYDSAAALQYYITAKDAQLLRSLAGPHGQTIYKMLIARKS